MRFKYYLRGLGIGIFVTTVILMISFRIHEEKITDTDIVIRAKELGMVFADDLPNGSGDGKDKNPQDAPQQGEGQNPTDNEPGNEGGEENPGGTDPGNGDNPDGTDDPGNSDNPGGADNPGGGENPGGADNPGGDGNPGNGENSEAGQQPGTAVTYIITVADGDYCRQIAEKLAANGLIQDTDEFCKFMQMKELDNDIQNGDYVVPAGADYETIANILNPR